MSKETYTCEKRPINVEGDLHMWKETYTCEKRPINVEGDLYMWKETYTCEKRPIYVEKDLYHTTYLLLLLHFLLRYEMHVKRDVYM